MEQQESDTFKNESFINIRKLAALDIVLHGPKLILAEFALAVCLCGALSIFSFFVFFSNPGHPLFSAIVGCFLSWIALNYVPLLLYAISIVKHRSAQEEVAFELAHRDRYVRKYTLQSLLLVVPLVIPALALYQEWQKRSRS